VARTAGALPERENARNDPIRPPAEGGPPTLAENANGSDKPRRRETSH
jgi:hypothetical protein